MAKEHEYRVSLTLNRNDPLHRTAITALEAQGRRKTQFVVNAITPSYIMEGKGREELTMPDRPYIEEICIEVCQSIFSKNPSVLPQTLPVPKEDMDEGCEIDENMGFIAESLNSFRNKP